MRLQKTLILILTGMALVSCGSSPKVASSELGREVASIDDVISGEYKVTIYYQQSNRTESITTQVTLNSDSVSIEGVYDFVYTESNLNIDRDPEFGQFVGHEFSQNGDDIAFTEFLPENKITFSFQFQCEDEQALEPLNFCFVSGEKI